MKLQSWDLWVGRLPPAKGKGKKGAQAMCWGHISDKCCYQEGQPGGRSVLRAAGSAWPRLKLQTTSTDLGRSMLLQRIKSSNGARFAGLLAGQNHPPQPLGSTIKVSILKHQKREWPGLASSWQQSRKWIIRTSGKSKPHQKKWRRAWIWCCTLWWVLKRLLFLWFL